MAKINIFDVIKLLFNPDVSKKLILQIALQQIKAVGVAKILSAALARAVVAGSSVVKVPQIRKVLKNDSLDKKVAVVKGLSLEGISLELFDALVHASYNIQNGNAFVTYGESLLIGVQNVILILLVQYFRIRGKLAAALSLSEREQIKAALAELYKPFGIILGSAVFLTKVAPLPLVSFLQILKIPMSVSARLLQIKQNHTIKSASHLSDITVGANTLGSLIRVFTTVQDFRTLNNDYVLLTGYTCSFLTNAALAAQCYYYKNIHKDKSDKDKQE